MERFERFLTKREVAEMLQVTLRTIERWVEAGILPYVKLGRKQQSLIRFIPDDIRKLKEERSKDAT